MVMTDDLVLLSFCPLVEFSFLENLQIERASELSRVVLVIVPLISRQNG
jgi:hypothetical protein